jgi:para-aminobenzoate synthetase component 1
VTFPRCIELPYQPDSTVLVEAIADRPWTMFLDTGHPGSDQGRYDILTADPYLWLSTRGSVTAIADRSQQTLSDDDPFALLRHYLNAEPSSIETFGLPFSGGAVGYFAYDLGRRIERLPERALTDIALPDMAIGLFDWAVVVDHQEKRAHLVAQGRDEHTRALWDERVQQFSQHARPAKHIPSMRILSPPSSNMDRDYYAQAFQRTQTYIRNGDCYQINLAQRFSAHAEGSPWCAYKRLRRVNPAPYSAYLKLPDGAVLSSSPERFLCVRGGEVETKPIKGTRPRAAWPANDHISAQELLSSVKDRAENLMIVDLLRNDLGKTCEIGSIRVPKLFALESFATVHHLVSTITGRLAPGRHALDLLRGCFPGGSITGAPKLRAMEIIEELEPHRRSVYCGAIGYIGYDGDMDLNIAIRTLVHHAGRLHCWAGGGIVADSVMENEYQESFDKAAAMLKLFDTDEVRSATGD